MKNLIPAICLFFTLPSVVFPQLVINEIMYAPADASNEWFEIFNGGSQKINLKNWKWKDATSTLRTITVSNVIVDTMSFAVICQDSIKFRQQFPNVPVTVIQTAWSQLNNSGDNLILIDSSLLRTDSVVYSSSWGGNTGGYSLERISSTGNSNSQSNWGSSIDVLRATPGKRNSITPKQHDLYLKTFSFTPLFPVKGSEIKFEFTARNIGLNEARNFSLDIYNDSDFDSSAHSSELIHSESFGLLNPGDSVIYSLDIVMQDTGKKQFIANVNYAFDNDPLNNKVIKAFYVSEPFEGFAGVVINEIMYDPAEGSSEWIEVFNASGTTVNLKRWKYKELSLTASISDTDLVLKPGEFLVLARDSGIYNSFGYLSSHAANQHVRFVSSLSLNNSGEKLTITDSLENVIDEVSYDADWNSPELIDTKGISLERLNPAFGSNERSSWNSCADKRGGTPGLQNSIFLKNKFSNSSVEIMPNPFSPDGDGVEDFTLIKYRLSIPFGQMRVSVFDIKGRQVRTISNNAVTGSEGSIIFDGFDNDRRKLRIGIYILLIEAIDDVNGVVDVIKTPLVIAAKL